MKKRLAFHIVLVLVVCAAVFYFYPRHVSAQLKGMEYQLGKNNASYGSPVRVDIQGTLMRSIEGVRTFKGIIHITGASAPNPDNNREATVVFRRNDDYGDIIYGYWTKNGTPVNRGYGVMFMSNNFKDLSIAIWPKDQGWSTNGGLMISAPAQKRPQALALSNKLMRNFLKVYAHGHELQ